MIDKIFSFAATETGYNHIKAEPSRVCEDASGFYDDDKMHICVVADGHGSDNYPRTDRGSQFAVDAAIEQIKAFVQMIYNPVQENPERSEKESNELIEKLLYTKFDETHLLKYLSRNILMKWREFVEKDVDENPFQEDELVNVSEKYKKRYMPEDISERRAEKAYGCTLIAYVVTDKFSFGMQIGDGKCVVIDQEGTVSEPIPWDENCQMNVTTSICDSDASDEFRFFVTEEKPSAVFCSSDGIDDSYVNVEDMYELYRSILKIFVEYGSEVGKSEIKEYLPVLTKRGSGDDVSIALIMDIQRATELTPVFIIQTEIFNLNNQLKEKQHQVVVNEEKDKVLDSKKAHMQKNKLIHDVDIVNQLNALRLQTLQLCEEINTIEEKISDLLTRMPNVVAQCEPEMTEVNYASDCGAVKTEEDTMAQETAVAEYVETAARTEECEDEEKATPELQKIVRSEKTVTISEQMTRVSQMAELAATDEEIVGDTKTSDEDGE